MSKIFKHVRTHMDDVYTGLFLLCFFGAAVRFAVA